MHPLKVSHPPGLYKGLRRSTPAGTYHAKKVATFLSASGFIENMGQEVCMYYEWHDRLPSTVFEGGEVALKRALAAEFDRHLYLQNALGFVP